MNNSLDRIKNELKDKQIYVSNDWLEQVTSEQINGLNRDFNFYYKKWLDTNLLDLDYSNIDLPELIPDESKLHQKVNLNGTFQIIEVKDISRTPPNNFCEDLYKRPNNEFDEHEDRTDGNTNEQQQTNRTVIKPTNRHLILELFNGKRMLRALEYEPINHLNFNNCFPGAKIVLRGEIEISLGILLLKSRNISPLGGIRLEVYSDQNEDQSNNRNNDRNNDLNNEN